jgi:D-sedoheptulose 7-phosphate isomerase
MERSLLQHLDRTRSALDDLADNVDEILAWGDELATRLMSGGKLLVAGNGGSAAQAQHLTAELVGRYRGERRPLCAFPLHADTSAVTAIGNDYGVETIFARQVEAHGQPGDVLLLLSTSGASENLLRAAARAGAIGVETWAMTGSAPNPLIDSCDRAVAVHAETTAAAQEMHLVLIHLLCECVDLLVPGESAAALHQIAKEEVR